MEAREIYHVLKSIVEPIHAHNDQMVVIAKWIEAEFEYKPQKQANGVDKSASNCNIPLVSGSFIRPMTKACKVCVTYDKRQYPFNETCKNCNATKGKDIEMWRQKLD